MASAFPPGGGRGFSQVPAFIFFPGGRRGWGRPPDGPSPVPRRPPQPPRTSARGRRRPTAARAPPPPPRPGQPFPPPLSRAAEGAGGREKPGDASERAGGGARGPAGRPHRGARPGGGLGATRTRERARGTADTEGRAARRWTDAAEWEPPAPGGSPSGDPAPGPPRGEGERGRRGPPGGAGGRPGGAARRLGPPPPPTPVPRDRGTAWWVGRGGPVLHAERRSPAGLGLREGARGPGRAWHAHAHAAAGGGDGGARPSAPRLPSWHRAR